MQEVPLSCTFEPSAKMSISSAVASVLNSHQIDADDWMCVSATFNLTCMTELVSLPFLLKETSLLKTSFVKQVEIKT